MGSSLLTGLLLFSRLLVVCINVYYASQHLQQFGPPYPFRNGSQNSVGGKSLVVAATSGICFSSAAEVSVREFQVALMSVLGLELLKACPTTTFQGGIFRSYFFSAGKDGSSSSYQQEKPKSYLHGRTTVVKPPEAAVDRSRVKVLFSLGKYADLSPFSWPHSWLKIISGRLQHFAVENVLRSVKSPRKNIYLARSGQHRRMLQNTSGRNQKIGEKSSVLEGGVKYNAIKIDTQGKLQHLELKSSELGLHPRDVDMLSSSTFIPQRATIAVQGDKVLVRMENVRAIVFKDHVLLFDARHPRISVEKVFASARSKESSRVRARDAFATSLAQQTKETSSTLLDPMPFHLRVMESLLEETSNFFHQKVDRLKLVVERMLQELTEDVSMSGLQRLLPLRRAVTEIEHDIRDAHEAMDQVLRSDEVLQALCLVNEDSRPGVPFAVPDPQYVNSKGSHTPVDREEHIYKLRQATADMLFTYQREVDDAGGVLEELRKGMEAAQEVWELGLGTTRNRIIRMNLFFSITTCSLAVATLPAAFFGMNLLSGFEEHPTLFFWVVGAASAASVVMLVGIALAFQVWPKISDRRRAQDLAGLLDLLRHLDSVDDIVEAVACEVTGKAVTRKEFHDILRSHPSAQLMRQKELDLIFRMFDKNRNGFLENEERKEMSSAFPGSKKVSSSNREDM